MFGRQSSLFFAAREASCHHTHRWTPFFKCTLASSWRCAANNLFIYSSRPRYFTSCSCVTKLKVQFCSQRKRFEECAQNLIFHVGGPRHPCGFAAAGSSCCKKWVSLSGFDPRINFVLGGVRINIDCMNLVAVISRYAGTHNLKLTLLCSILWAWSIIYGKYNQ